MIELNPFSYKAMETKISRLKPKALRELAESLVSEVYKSYQSQREEKLNHYVYCLKAVVLIENRLKDTSKISVKKETASSYSYALERLIETINKHPNKLTVVDLSDIMFNNDDDYYSYSIKSFNDLAVLNRIYSEFKDKSLKPSISMSISPLLYFNGVIKKQMAKQWCINNLEPNAEIFKLFNDTPTKEPDVDKIEQFEQTAKILKQLKEKYDEEQSAIN